ncbi:hypothetical protein [Tsukamurella tyrosinosolvens]|uniref:hypothetical protein n=1 Tax=Tsukamurella tyrosinosolvens TaxID=57704 RepID=UPI000AFD8632|nr:hypothetical protein [Tsukamurella tyrosinosolvens]
MAQVEVGHLAPDLLTLHAIAIAIAELSGNPVALADLLPADGEHRALSAALRGVPVAPTAASLPALPDPTLARGWGQVDDRLCKELDLFPIQVQVATSNLFGRTATEERDSRAGSDATPQKKGRVTRDLLHEVATEVNRVAAAESFEEAERHRRGND